MNPGFWGYITMTGQPDNKWRRDSSFYNKAEYIIAHIKRKVSFLFLFPIKEKEQLSVETHSEWSQEMAFVKIWTTEWNIRSGLLLILTFLLVIAKETLIKLQLRSLLSRWDILWLPETVVAVNNSLCKRSPRNWFCSKKIIKDQVLLLTSQLIAISCGKWASILIFSGFLSGAVEKKEYRFCRHY